MTASIFKVTSGKMLCSDPSYPKDTWCQGLVDAKNGDWKAETISDDSGYVSRMFAYNISSASGNPSIKTSIKDFKGESMPFTCAVDGGLLGFFDYNSYVGKDEPQGGESQWYKNCSQICSEGTVVVPSGCVCTAGHGDGAYEMRGIKDSNGSYVALCVEFFVEAKSPEEFLEDLEELVEEGRSVYLEMVVDNHFKMYKLEDISNVHEEKFEIRTTWGRIGCDAIQQVQKFDTQEALDKYFDKQINSKRAKGYKNRKENKALAITRHQERSADSKAVSKAKSSEKKKKETEEAKDAKAKKAGSEAIVQKAKSSAPKNTAHVATKVIDLTDLTQ